MGFNSAFKGLIRQAHSEDTRFIFSLEALYYNSNNHLDNVIQTFLDLDLVLTNYYFIYGIYGIIVFLQYQYFPIYF